MFLWKQYSWEENESGIDTNTHHKPGDRPDVYTLVAEGGWQGISDAAVMSCQVKVVSPPRLLFAFIFYLSGRIVLSLRYKLSCKSSYTVLCVYLALFHSTVVCAQDEKLHVLIDEGRLDREISEVDRETTSSVHSVIEVDRLRDSFISLPEMLEQEVGVQIRSSGGAGGLSVMVLRGSSSEQTIIYLDGVPLNDASGGFVDLSLIPLNSIERIEIYRGSTPLALGRPSIGGAVNIISVKPDNSFTDQLTSSGQLSASIASFHTYKLSGTTSLSNNTDEVLLSASYLQSKNDFSFVNDNGTQFNLADDRVEKQNNDGVKHLSVLSKWKHRISKKFDTELRLDVLDREKQIASVNNNADVKTRLDTQQYNLLAQLNVNELWAKNTRANLKFSLTHKNEVFDDSLAQIGFINQRTTSVNNKVALQLFAEINQQHSQWKLLTALSHESYDTQSSLARVESGINTRDSAELSLEKITYLDQQRLILNLVLRYQAIFDEVSTVSNSFGVVTPGFDKTYQFINPQLGAKYRFNKRTYVTANIGRYTRAPSFLELFGGDGLLRGNTSLKQESSLNTDLGLTYTWYKPYNWLHDAELYTGVFYNKIEDLIVRIFNGQGIGIPQNISDAVIRGFESTLKITPSIRHSVNVSITLIDSINQTEITSFNGKVLPGYYQQSVSLRYAYSFNRWLVSAEADIKRNLFYDRSNLLQGDDVNLINLGLRRYFQNSNIDFRINNILDENIRYFRNRPTPGLSLSLTYNHSF